MSYIGNSPGVASQRVETAFTATSSQTVFTPTSGYTLGYCDVYQNGVKLVNGDDYTASDGATVTLATGAASGDSIVIVASFPRGLSDGYLKSEADAKYVALTGAQTVAGVKTFSSQIVGIAGTAGAPAVTTTGDTDTGIFFPAANTLAFSTNGTEDARFDSNGKFLIGGNASDLSSTTQAMVMGSGGLAVQHAGTTGTYLKVTPGAADGVVDVRADARSGGYPALTFTTGAAERARIDASGNFGVGTNSPLAKLDIKGDTTSYGTMSKIYLTDSNSNTASRNWSIGNGGSAFGNLTFSVSAAKDGNAGDSTSLVRMVIDPGGNVGLATPSPSARLTIGLQSYTASATSGMIRFKNDQTTADGCIQSYSVSSTTGTDIVIGSNFYITTSGTFDRFNASRESSYQIVSRDGTIYWGTGGTGATAVDRMRLDSSGNFMVGVTSPLASSTFSVKGPNNANQQPVAIWNPGSSGTRYLISFATDTTYGERGYITYNGSTVAIAQASDERLKENIVDAPSALSTISAIQIRSFDFKADGRHVEFGVVAQELHGVVPSAVFEGADNEDGTVNKPWSVGLEPVVPILVKALQEALLRIEQLEADVATLKGTP